MEQNDNKNRNVPEIAQWAVKRDKNYEKPIVKKPSREEESK